MGYSNGSHSIVHHCYHIVWAPKDRYKVLHGEVRLRVREIIHQVCAELEVAGARSAPLIAAPALSNSLCGRDIRGLHGDIMAANPA